MGANVSKLCNRIRRRPRRQVLFLFRCVYSDVRVHLSRLDSIGGVRSGREALQLLMHSSYAYVMTHARSAGFLWVYVLVSRERAPGLMTGDTEKVHEGRSSSKKYSLPRFQVSAVAFVHVRFIFGSTVNQTNLELDHLLSDDLSIFSRAPRERTSKRERELHRDGAIARRNRNCVRFIHPREAERSRRALTFLVKFPSPHRPY